jgi:hypothetical protein
MPLRSFLKIDRENGDSSSFENDPSSNGVETSPSFNYNKIGVTDQPTIGHGVLGTPQTFTFDVNELKEAATVSSDIVSSDIVSSDIVSADIVSSNIVSTDMVSSDIASSDIVSSAGLSAASAAVPVPASSPLHYFLKIDGVSGDSTVKGFEGWFSVDGYDIGVQNTGSLSSGGGGGALAKRSSHR